MLDFEAFVEQHPDLYTVLAEDGIVLYCNNTIERACGYAPAAFSGDPILESIVDAHGWSIAVTDGTDGGARFEITGVEFAE